MSNKKQIQCNKDQVVKGCLVVIAVYILFVLAFYFIGGEQVQYTQLESKMAKTSGVIGDILDDTVITQEYNVEMERISRIDFFCGTYGRENEGSFKVRLLDKADNRCLYETEIQKEDVDNDSNYKIFLDEEIPGMKGKTVVIEVTSPGSTSENAITMYAGDKTLDGGFYINGQEQSNQLCFNMYGNSDNFFGDNYWYIALGVLIILVILCLIVVSKFNKQKKVGVIEFANVWMKYRFLIKQLVSRDFKVKYKRSALGFLWSFLNPLLMMVVQYVIFSTIFRNNIENFPVYLLTGSVFFNFFSESVGAGLGAIVVNASLITKVFVPKTIYPLTKVLATAINLLISMVPLLLTVLITGESITPAFLFLPFVMICIIIFCIGMSFFLSSSMVFFRDTQFLWGIVSLVWMYATPLFYPESIVPDRFSFVLKLNPLYHYIRFARTVLMDGVSPTPFEYLTCLVSALIFLIGGYIVFKKTENKFTLYI